MLQVVYDGQLFRDSIFRLSQAKLAPLPFHSFTPGAVVFLSQGTPGESSLQATVVDFSSKWLRIAVSMSASDGIQVCSSHTSQQPLAVLLLCVNQHMAHDKLNSLPLILIGDWDQSLDWQNVSTQKLCVVTMCWQLVKKYSQHHLRTCWNLCYQLKLTMLLGKWLAVRLWCQQYNLSEVHECIRRIQGPKTRRWENWNIPKSSCRLDESCWNALAFPTATQSISFFDAQNPYAGYLSCSGVFSDKGTLENQAARLPKSMKTPQAKEKLKACIKKQKQSSRGLNLSQIEAVENALQRTLTLWQGYVH